ncbi:MAG: response regulator transcription factor [Acidobacteria bacterium]|nr:response regulator transcription factor [Acidobacteriota bacterium]
MAKRPRVLLADDHTLVLEGLRRLLEDRCELVGMVEDGRALVEAAPKLSPDIVLLDISMPLLNGLDAARRLRTLVPDTRIIFLTMHADPTYASEAFDAGAAGYLLKRSAASELNVAIATVLAGRKYLTPLITSDALRASVPRSVAVPPTLGRLTPRQREVLQLVAEGHTAKDIAARLGISVKTVEFHKAGIMDRLGVRTASELTKYAVAHGVTELP